MKRYSLLVALSMMLGLVLSVGYAFGQEPPAPVPSANGHLTKDVIASMIEANGQHVVFEATPAGVWQRELEVTGDLMQDLKQVLPRGYRADIYNDGTVHIRFHSLASAVMSDSVPITGPTWLDISQARHDAWAAQNAAMAPLRQARAYGYNQYPYPSFGGYGGVYPQLGGYGYHPWMKGCQDGRSSAYLEFQYRGKRGEKHLWLVSINGIGPGTVDQADTFGQKLPVCADAAVIVTVEKIGEGWKWERQYSLRPFTSTEIPVGEFLETDKPRVQRW